MRAILDTHALLWFLAGDDRLSARARRLVEDGSNEMLVSVASLWEIAVKHSLGKLDLAGSFEQVIPGQLEANGLAVLHLATSHVARVATLPFHHRDPFDRMLIAQALVEGLPIVGVDTAFDPYGTERIW
jgi:PIN domain nuclease of toxin-antitoxin system